MYSVKASATFLRSAIAKTKNEEKSTDSYSLDAIVNAIDSKIQYINKRVVNYIKADATLLAKAKLSTNDLFNENDTYNTSVFYPTQSTINECE